MTTLIRTIIHEVQNGTPASTAERLQYVFGLAPAIPVKFPITLVFEKGTSPTDASAFRDDTLAILRESWVVEDSERANNPVAWRIAE